MITPDQATTKWAQRMGSSGTAYTDGINRQTVSPTQLAARHKTAYVMGVQEAANSGKWERGLARVSLDQWKQAAIQKGAARLAAGAQAAVPKMLAFMQKFLPYVANAQQQVKSMDNSTYEARKARASAMMDLLHAFPGA